MSNRDLILEAAFGERELYFTKMSFSSGTEMIPSVNAGLPVVGKIRGIGNVLDSIAVMESNSVDILTPLSCISFAPALTELSDGEGNSVSFHNLVLENNKAEFDAEPLPFSDWAMSQTCQVLGVPSSYARRCIVDDATPLICQNLNHWKTHMIKEKQDKEYLLRITDNRIRGFLSDKYCSFDDSVFFNSVLSAIPSDAGSFTIFNQIVSPNLTKVRIISDEKISIDGDDYSVGLDICNSRVGRSSVKIQLLLFRHICTNGQLLGGGIMELIRKRHHNIEPITLEGQIQELISNLPEITTNVKTWVESSRERKIDNQNLETVLSYFKARVINSDTAVQQVKALMLAGYGQNMWGYSQAISEMAQLYPVFTRETLEAYSGHVLQSNHWR